MRHKSQKIDRNAHQVIDNVNVTVSPRVWNVYDASFTRTAVKLWTIRTHQGRCAMEVYAIDEHETVSLLKESRHKIQLIEVCRHSERSQTA